MRSILKSSAPSFFVSQYPDKAVTGSFCINRAGVGLLDCCNNSMIENRKSNLILIRHKLSGQPDMIRKNRSE